MGDQFAKMNLSLCYLFSCDIRHLRHFAITVASQGSSPAWECTQMVPLVTQIHRSWDQGRACVPLHGCP